MSIHCIINNSFLTSGKDDIMKEFFYSSNNKFTDIEKKVLEYLHQNQEILHNRTIQQLADETFTSKSTIFRLTKKLGFSGYTDMIYHLKKGQALPGDEAIDKYVSDLSNEIQKVFLQNEITLNDFMNQLYKDNRSIYIIGTGYAGIIAEYLYKKILGQGELVYFSNGADSNALFLNNLHRITDIICISKSGETESVYSKATIAREKGIGVVSFTHSSDNTLARVSDIPFVIDDNQFLDPNNINSTQFYSMLLLYLEYVIEKTF